MKPGTLCRIDPYISMTVLWFNDESEYLDYICGFISLKKLSHKERKEIFMFIEYVNLENMELKIAKVLHRNKIIYLENCLIEAKK